MPKRRSKRNKQGLNQQLIQTMPPTDDCISGLQTRPILVLMEPSPLLAPSIPQTPALQQDRVTEESTSKTVSQPPKPTEDRSSGNETPILHNPWGKTKREQLQSWNILSFDPKNTDVDEHIDLINTLGDMVDQKEEAKKEMFIETMPTMIQTHLILCKDWADVKDKAKSHNTKMQSTNSHNVIDGNGCNIIGIVFTYSTFGGQRRG